MCLSTARDVKQELGSRYLRNDHGIFIWSAFSVKIRTPTCNFDEAGQKQVHPRAVSPDAMRVDNTQLQLFRMASEDAKSRVPAGIIERRQLLNTSLFRRHNFCNAQSSGLKVAPRLQCQPGL